MFKRVLLKLSGEALSGEGRRGFDSSKASFLAKELRKVVEKGIKVGIVVGAGNIFRGKELEGVDPKIADHIGMLGTVMNALYMKHIFENEGIFTRIFSNIVTLPSVYPMNYDLMMEALEKGEIVIFSGGTGNPFFTTDTAAALRAVEMGAEVLIKATKVDGVYDKDPKKFKDAKKFKNLTYDDAINMRLRIMDMNAFLMCKEFSLPIIVLDAFKEGNLLRTVMGEVVGTLISR